MGKADLWGWYFSLTAVPAILWLISYPFTGKSTLAEMTSDDLEPTNNDPKPNVVDSKIAQTEK